MTPNYRSLGADVGAAVGTRAVFAAADRVSEVLRVFYPNGVPAAQIDSLPLVVRIVERLCLVVAKADGATVRDIEASPWFDIVGFGLVGLGGDKERATDTQRAIAAVVVEEGPMASR